MQKLTHVISETLIMTFILINDQLTFRHQKDNSGRLLRSTSLIQIKWFGISYIAGVLLLETGESWTVTNNRAKRDLATFYHKTR